MMLTVEKLLGLAATMPKMTRVRIISGGPVGPDGCERVGDVWFLGSKVIASLPRDVAQPDTIHGLLSGIPVETFGSHDDHTALAAELSAHA